MSKTKQQGEELSEEECQAPCTGLVAMKGEFKSIKTGAYVSAFFVGLIFLYVASEVSQIREMSKSMIVIEAKVTQLADHGNKGEIKNETIQRELRKVADRVCQIETILKVK